MKKMTFILALALTGSALVATGSINTRTSMAAVQGQVYTMPEAGIQFQLPAGWRAKRDAGDIYVWTKDESVQTVFFVPDAETFDQTLRQLDKELGRTIKRVKTSEKDTSDTLNGMRHFSTGGTGEVEGDPVEWGVDILEAKKVVVALFFAAPGAFDDHSRDVNEFIDSITRMSASRPPVAARNDRILMHDEAGFQFELPKGWRSEERGEDMFLWTADETVQVDIWVPESATFDLALRNMDKDLSRVVKNARIIDQGTSDTHNGMRHFSTSGTGTVDGKRSEWSVDILDAKKVVLILSFWRPGIADRHAGEGLLFFNSIKRLN